MAQIDSGSFTGLPENIWKSAEGPLRWAYSRRQCHATPCNPTKLAKVELRGPAEHRVFSPTVFGTFDASKIDFVL